MVSRTASAKRTTKQGMYALFVKCISWQMEFVGENKLIIFIEHKSRMIQFYA